ncbi:type II toxin-antitoxin system RelE family toxin [Xenorhabdus bovienii]|uniref:type II toxin-antitoxin system RelE family toxin n=1 Tax=Xenorhabdus bovienii TaxID=40576 RepID=UPI0004DAD9BE|nr:type II toxin-antitoxin system RelE/ParE family toxin [Xenorhabdus bovienii]CDG88130.1 conserved hypothetical protein [Xenorhabdus bovienii str. feltiae France]CDG91797.1 conserved hypothetical protein [Xenorhabdus bovienii str. feltiae Florida]
MVKIYWSGRAVKDLRKIPENDQESIRNKINELSNYPTIIRLDIKKLVDDNNQYRLRVGNYRVIFEIQKGEPVLIKINTVVRRSNTTYK